MKFKQFIKENKTAIITIFILGLITYGLKLVTYSFSIDTEYFLVGREQMLSSWLKIGRYGLVFIKRIIDFTTINLYLANFVSFIIFFFAVIVCLYNVAMITNKKSIAGSILLGGFIITSPIAVQQYNYTLQCVEVNLALLLVALVFTIINKQIINESKNIFLTILAVLMSILSFSCYQSTVPLFITFSAFFTMLFIKYKNKKNFKIVLKYILIFFISIVSYKLIDVLVLHIMNIKDSQYLSNQILWVEERHYPKTEPYKHFYHYY